MERLGRLVPGGAVSLALLVGALPTTWLLPKLVGYLLSGVFVIVILALTIQSARIVVPHWPVLAGLGVYWIVLIVHLGLTGSPSVIPYIGLVPLTIVALVFGGAQLIWENRGEWAVGVVTITTLLAICGFLLLAFHVVLDWGGLSMTGRRTLGMFNLRISSIYDNSNHLGFTSAVGAVTAIYLWQENKLSRWIILGVFLYFSIVMANARASVVAATLAIGIMVVHNRRQVKILLPIATLTLVAATITILSEFLDELVRSLTLRFDTWVTTIDTIITDPLIGAAWDASLGSHNMFIIVMYQAGLIGGLAYIGAHLFALWYAVRAALSGNTWDRYVCAMLVFLLVTQFFSTSTLGGLTTPSLLLALFVGLGGRKHSMSIRQYRYDIVQQFRYRWPGKRTE
ncbi:O-antigen ligase family protein [Saliphagus infecundisoli]|uniref:O-antigen ligase family protein n=1 Tax=Saliphagus infecundisoli TaxID=1849069 RepID=A0ABD5QJA4_9EURY|nr:hypothetical protein [Saliphagus infecundisoli]